MNSISLLNLDRFDGYPDSGDKIARPLSVLEKWQELGYDPAEDTGIGSLCFETLPPWEHMKPQIRKEPPPVS